MVLRLAAGERIDEERVPGLPRYRLHYSALCAVLVCGGLAGCTTSELAGGLELEAQQFSFAGADPVLPDTVEVTPAVFPLSAEMEEMVSSAPAVAYAAPASAGAAAIAAVTPRSGAVAARSPELDALIARYAAHHEIPLELLRRVVNRESTFNPAARNGPYWGLMQILPQTARTMGYRGAPEGLLDAETNLKYAGKYLRGAYLVAGGDHDLAVRYYARGYYYDAKRRGMLEATGLGKDRRRMRDS